MFQKTLMINISQKENFRWVQSNYTKKILEKFHMENSKAIPSPGEYGKKYTKILTEISDKEKEEIKNIPY